jgi:hypothetical protein
MRDPRTPKNAPSAERLEGIASTATRARTASDATASASLRPGRRVGAAPRST